MKTDKTQWALNEPLSSPQWAFTHWFRLCLNFGESINTHLISRKIQEVAKWQQQNVNFYYSTKFTWNQFWTQIWCWIWESQELHILWDVVTFHIILHIKIHFEKSKNCFFHHFRMSEIGFFGNLAHLKVSNLAKMTLLDSAKSSSHNKSAEKLVKFHTVIIRVN